MGGYIDGGIDRQGSDLSDHVLGLLEVDGVPVVVHVRHQVFRPDVPAVRVLIDFKFPLGYGEPHPRFQWKIPLNEIHCPVD